MKKKLNRIWLITVALGTSFATMALESPTSSVKGPKQGNQVQAKGANCAPATGVLKFEFNNVRTLLQQGGLLHRQVGGQQNAAYEVPKNGGRTVIYAGSLWMGGVDVNGQLKLAALTFKQRGNDFWPGPLSVTPGSGNYNPNVQVGDDVVRDYGEANVDPDVCAAYDKFYTIRKGEVIRFNLWWECENVTPQPEGCNEVEKPSSEELNRIYNWPAHGDVGRGQDYYLAPFYDRDGDGVYNPLNGDHPWYDDILGRDDIECGIDRRISLFGDETHWWVFNDKGNIHQESNGDPIGMEIRAQAFAFATNDEVNNMTFYNYELINRGTQTLFSTYFSQYMDADVGYAADDYVGCDVSRGLGFAFNGDNLDETNGSQIGYGENPPAVGVDFFEGPYQDADSKDNLGPVYDSVSKTYVSPSVNDAIADNGIVYRGIGTGYSDGIVDNERFGMRRFTYYTNGATFPYTDPSNAAQFYNYMSGFWQDGSSMFYGGAGYAGSTGATTILADYLFPGDSDPLDWSTKGIDPGVDWDEQSSGNPVGDRRFVQSAGPFTLKPGAVNNITVGVVYARGTDGDLFSSVRALKRADTKAQALFDNCFRILSPPDAPRLRIQELENELILMLDNPASSNNYRELYEEEDKINIVDEGVDRFYRFEGYQIYQLKSVENSVSDISDPTKARLVAQCDIKNYEKDANGKDILTRPIARLINFEFDEALGYSIPVEKVAGANQGISHSFKVTEDQFAQGSRTLVNHKTYYYVAIAYAYNNFKTYNPSDPLQLDGQKLPYISSFLGFDKKAIVPVVAIPHNPLPEANGTLDNPLAVYGTSPRITRIDGHGNGAKALELTSKSEDFIVENGFMAKPEYDLGKGPINVKVVDPLNVADGYYEIKFVDYNVSATNAAPDSAQWILTRYSSEGGDSISSITSEVPIGVNNEQLIPEWGISVQVNQSKFYFENGGTSGSISEKTTDILESSLTFEDSSKRWFEFVTDADGFLPNNWIRSGIYTIQSTDPAFVPANGYNNARCYPDEVGIDPGKRWSRILNGGVAPHRLVGYQCDFMPLAYYKASLSYPNAPESSPGTSRTAAGLSFSPSVNIVITPDTKLWTRCPVIELGRDANLNVGGAKPGQMRKSPSVGKDGKPDLTGTGMSWFPGYAVDVETGARLYMAFGENSFLGNDNGTDMIWNPSDRLFDEVGNPVLGGMQPIYVFNHKSKTINGNSQSYDLGYYDPKNTGNNELKTLLDGFTGTTFDPVSARNFYSSLAWIAHIKGTRFQNNLATKATIKLRVNKEYKNFVASNENGGKPKYSWNMNDLATRKNDASSLADALKKINVVPNPYYAYSEYERSRLDTRVKITNLPERCEIRIFSTNGKLVRSYSKDSEITSLDWDLNNFKGIPVSSGIYLIHVSVPEIGEVVIKFYGGVRQVDLQGI